MVVYIIFIEFVREFKRVGEGSGSESGLESDFERVKFWRTKSEFVIEVSKRAKIPEFDVDGSWFIGLGARVSGLKEGVWLVWRSKIKNFD